MATLARTYEIFSGPSGSATAEWREHIGGLGCAYERMRELARKEPGPYFIFCSQTHRVLAQIDTTITKPNHRRACA
jgi:hypothetical protein